MTINKVIKSGRRFSLDDIKKCDKIALNCLNTTEKQIIKSRRIYEKFDAIHYKESGRDGDGLFVCRDGSVLFADSEITVDSHLKALQSGIRSSLEKLWKRRDN